MDIIINNSYNLLLFIDKINNNFEMAGFIFFKYSE